MCAACRRSRVKPHRGLDAAEELQPKLPLLLNRQMFVQGFDTENRPAILLLLLSGLNRQIFVQGVDAENRLAPLLLLLSSLNCQMFVLGFGPALLPPCLLCVFSCGQSASPVSERGSPHVPFQQAMV